MILEQYGITLSRLTKEDTELVRQMRNRADIRQHFAYRKTISNKQQKKWFDSINNKFNYFFLIIYQNEKIGVINCKDVNVKEGWGEGGIFLWEKKYFGTDIPVRASVLLIDFIFYTLKIKNKSFVRIMRDNKKSIQYNQFLGYTLVPHQQKIENQIYILTMGDYEKHAFKLRKSLQILSGDFSPLLISGKKSELNLDVINQLLS